MIKLVYGDDELEIPAELPEGYVEFDSALKNNEYIGTEEVENE